MNQVEEEYKRRELLTKSYDNIYDFKEKTKENDDK